MSVGISLYHAHDGRRGGSALQQRDILTELTKVYVDLRGGF
jgi:hypothetical protein